MASKKIEFEVEILEVYEQNGILRVKTRCKYGENDLGLDIKKKYLHPVTQEPLYIKEVKTLLKNEYQNAAKKDVLKEHWGKKIKIEVD